MKLQLLVSVMAAGWMAGEVLAQAQAQTESVFEAVRRGDTAKIRTAIEAGADLNARDANGATLLMHTALYGKAADLEYLLAHGADVNATNNNGHTALMRAMPDLVKVKVLVEHGADVNASANGVTPLLIAAEMRNSEGTVRYLVEKGADLKAVNDQGFDAVMAAAQEGSVENLTFLLNAGASGVGGAKNRAVRARPGTVFDAAAIERIRKRGEGISALMNAARVDCEACARLLLEHGADAKARTDSGLTALHSAAFKGDLATVKLLLAAGAPVNVADDRGFTPLMMAANSRSKDPEVVRLLLEHGADVQSKDNFGRTAADWAQIGSRREIMAILPGPAAPVEVKGLGEPAFQDVRTAVAKSIALLEDAAPKFFPKAGCISCHNVSIPLMAMTEARRRGYAVNSSTTQLLVKQTLAVFRSQRENLVGGVCGLLGRAPAVPSYGLTSIHGEGYAPELLTDAIVQCIATNQYPDGHFFGGIDTRPPLSAESGIPDTALSARAIKIFAAPSLARDAQARVERARTYLLVAKPWSGDDLAYRLLGLLWTDATADQIHAATHDLVARQRPDGGWSQTPFMTSDAYETGLSLWALASADPGMIDASAYRRGVDYLMRTQEKDGSWHVRSRAFGFQPYFESGFPHGHDQWISMAATAWSAMALMPAADRATAAVR